MYNLQIQLWICILHKYEIKKKLKSYLKFINLFLSQDVKAYDCKDLKRHNFWDKGFQ